MPEDIDPHVTIVINTERRRHALLLPGFMEVGKFAIGVKGLLDTGADAVIVNSKLVDKYKLPTVRLPQTLTFRNADDSVNKTGTITHRVEGTFNLDGRKLPTNWYVANIGREDVILGIPWIRRYNPAIDWESGRVTFDPKNIKRSQQIHKYQTKHQPPEGTLWGIPTVPENQDLVLSFTTANSEEDDEELLIHNPSRVLGNLFKKTHSGHLRKINKSTEIAVAANKGKIEKSLKNCFQTILKIINKSLKRKQQNDFPHQDHGTTQLNSRRTLTFTQRNLGERYILSHSQSEVN